MSTHKPKPNQTTPSKAQPPNKCTAPFPRVPNRKSCNKCRCSKRIRFRHPLVTEPYATSRTPHLTKSEFHYSNKDIKLFKLRSRAQGEVPLQPRPQWEKQQAANINNKGAIYKRAARGYTQFKVKKVDMKERGPSVYADCRKTPGAGGNATVKSNKHKMREKDAGGYVVFRKTPRSARGYEKFHYKEWDRKETEARGYANFRKN